MTSVHPQPLLMPGQSFTSTRYCYKHFTGGLSKLKGDKTQLGPAAASQTTHSSSPGRTALKCAGFPINIPGPHLSNLTVYGQDGWPHLRFDVSTATNSWLPTFDLPRSSDIPDYTAL